MAIDDRFGIELVRQSDGAEDNYPDTDYKSPFAVVGLNKAIVRQLGLPSSESALATMRSFLALHRRTMARTYHPDVATGSGRVIGPISEAFDQLLKATDFELSHLIDEYLNGSDQESFSLRYRLQSALKELEEANAEVEQLKIRCDTMTRNLRGMEVRLSEVVSRVLSTLGTEPYQEGKATPFNYRGYGFFGWPEVRLSNKAVLNAKVQLLYIRPDGVVITQEVVRSFVRTITLEPAASASLLRKAIVELETAYSNEYGKQWKNLGYFMGFTSSLLLAERPKDNGQLGHQLGLASLAILARNIVKHDVVPEKLIGYDRLVTLSNGQSNDGRKFVLQATPFNHSPYMPIPPPW